MTEEREKKGAQQQKRLKGPTAKDFVRMNRVMTRIREYVLLGCSTGNLKLRNEAIAEGNDTKFAYMQGALDVCLDLKAIMDDHQLVVFREENKLVEADQQGYR